MAFLFDGHAVAVGALGGPTAWDAVEVEGIHVPAGNAYGRVVLRFPQAVGFKSVPAEGSAVAITLDTEFFWSGYVVRSPGAIGAGVDEQTLVLADLRWRLAQWRIGDSELSPEGGWPVVGYRVWFNPEGRGNRSAAKIEDGPYTFSTAPDAVAWTRADVMEWLGYYYLGSRLVVNLAGLSAAWAQPALNLYAHLLTVPELISELARQCGETWGVQPIAGSPPAANYVPIKPGGSSAFVVALPEAADGATVATAAANSALSVTGDTSIEDATDAVEVHTGPSVVEHTYNSVDAENPLLVAFAPTDWTFAKGYRVDVTKYAAHNLGQALAAGSRPKRWLRELVTRWDEVEEEYVAAGSAAELAGVGRALRPDECLWVRISSVRYRLLEGFEIRPEDGEILLLERGEGIHPDGYRVTLDLTDVDGAWLTVATETEVVDIYREEATGLLAEGAIAEAILRSDIVPAYRYAVDVPGWASGTVTSLAATLELYRNHEAALESIAAQALNARQRRETIVRCRCVDLTAAVALGRKLEISPAVTGLDADAVVVDVLYDFANRADAIEVTATNNLARWLR